MSGTAKRREVPNVGGSEQNKRSRCAKKGDGRSAASPTGGLPNASSSPAYQISVANPHLRDGVDASAQDPFDSARQGPVPGAFAGLQPGPEVEGQDAEQHLGRRGCPDDQEMTVSELTINENGVIRAPPQVDRVWAAIPIDHPWKGLISSEDEMLLVEAGYPTSFVEPYLELAHMSEDHVKLYWRLCIAKAAHIAADRLDAFIWLVGDDEQNDYVNHDREHHEARESFWSKQGKLIDLMRYEASIHADHRDSFMWQQCDLPREGLTTFGANTLFHRAAASLSIPRDQRHESNPPGLMDDNEINYISDAETEPADLYGSDKDLIDHLHLINRPEAEIDSIREELYRRRSLALRLEEGRIASFLKMTITEVRAPDYSRMPVPENESSDEFHERWKLGYEGYKFMMGWHNPADFNPSRSRSERDRASELSQDLLKALTAEFRYEYFQMDPQMRKIVSGLPDVWFKLLCHRGCTGKPSDQGRSINRALDSLNFHELDTLLDVNPNSEVPVVIQVQRNFALCVADMKQWSKWYTEIGDPHFKPTTCEICGESPISQDTAGINKTLALVKQEDWRRRVNRIGWHQVEVRVNTLTAWVFRQMILSRRFKIREIKMAITQVSETDGSDGQDRDGIE